MAFRVGQKVVCIGTKGTTNFDWDAWCAYWKVVKPTRGSTYTVRDTRIGRDGRQHIYLVEIVNPIVPFRDAPSQEKWFWAEAFRPVIEKKTDIGIFTKMLKPKQLERAAP